MRARVNNEFIEKLRADVIISRPWCQPEALALCDEVNLLNAALNDALDERGLPDWPLTFLVVNSFRYCLGRMTYAVDEMAGFLVKNWHRLPQGTQALIQRELERAFLQDDQEREKRKEKEDWSSRHPLGMDSHRRAWEKVRALYREDKAPR